MIKHTVQDLENGLEIRVVLLDSGKFSVTMKDLDCGEVLPVATIFPADAYDDAVAHAESFVDASAPISIPLI